MGGGGGPAKQRPELRADRPDAERTIVQGPTATISIGGQKGIHNNVSAGRRRLNNPFFGEQRGASGRFPSSSMPSERWWFRRAPMQNLDGRARFINVVTKSGTNEFHGSAHYFGKFDGLSADYSHEFERHFPPSRPISQNQFGMTFGGLIVKDSAFFIAYDQQEYKDVKQKTRRQS
jgi:hypothetical protein